MNAATRNVAAQLAAGDVSLADVLALVVNQGTAPVLVARLSAELARLPPSSVLAVAALLGALADRAEEEALARHQEVA